MEFVSVASEADLADGVMKGFEINGQEIVLARIDGEIFAIAGLCSHGFAHLEDGALDGFEVVCPLHIGRFDIRTGQPTKRPATEPIKIYPIKRQGDRIFVQLEGG